MAIAGIVFLLLMVAGIGVGIVAGTAALIASSFLIGLGVLSTSALMGIRSGKPFVALRMLLVQACVLLGLPSGAVCAWLVNYFLTRQVNDWSVLATGAATGALRSLRGLGAQCYTPPSPARRTQALRRLGRDDERWLEPLAKLRDTLHANQARMIRRNVFML